jgi:DNA processing protein
LTVRHSDAEPRDWLRLYRTDGIGPVHFFRLIERYGTAAAALAALPQIARRAGRPAPVPPSRAAADQELTALRRAGGQLLLASQAAFPPGLRVLEVAPLLMLLGDPGLLNRRSIAIVGARDASAAGQRLARQLAFDLGAAGFCVVSGLARGIDAAAHEGGLPGGTVAVLAGGVDVVYPREHAALYRRIIAEGAVVAEMPPGTQPLAPHFPRRNRLIAGLAQGVVVVEARLRSGSLITARLALEQGRDLFAVPGSPLEPRAQGPNSLIKQGAMLVENAEDVILGLGVAALPPPPPAPAPVMAAAAQDSAETLSLAHREVAALLSVTAVTVDEILRQCQLSAATLSLVLLELELVGRLERHSDQRVALRT